MSAREVVDRNAVARGALAGLVVIVPVTIVRAIAGETLQLPLEWLGRLGNGFEQATAAPRGSSSDWRAWALVAVLAGATIGVGRLAVAYRHLARLRCAR